ncbi:DNA helicase [Mycobacterium antarcticum]|uniref:ATP-dependent helicase n=1 Tax=unclassified Mycolicibacterium TaxID=2636767 RepID=UPI0023A27F2A|nr:MULTISPECIES: ATP-dependent DNA helicase [unclassified Mycolicibacterium]GLP76961.1 DNA helicase [Mycolicibacterium sp. TUM20983]GLP82618.1 DNA helicase [Mycolicibacterium sp. TUM20984]
MPSPRTALSPTALTDPGLRGTVRVVGGPGTGKSTLLVDTAAQRISAGTDPESVLLLTGSAKLSALARATVTAALLGGPGRCAVREPMIRTVHSYAFAVLKLAAQRNGDPPPRLITSAEQDGIIRELLAGDLEDGADASVRWPRHLMPALGTVGFANELRDLLARCTERGVEPAALQRIGRRAGRDEWVAAGRFAQVYEQVMLLRSAVGMAAPQATVPALGAAELVGAALEAFAADSDLLAAERGRIRLLLVDDAQNLDPQAALLVRVLAAGADLALIAGDPNQSVFGYRGADPALLGDGDHPTVILTESHRCASAVARAVTGLATRLPGVDDARSLTAANDRAGSLAVRITASERAESSAIADALRRAHLVDGVPWSQMAVIVRSVPRAGAALTRALTAAGVPVDQQASTGPLAGQPAVAALLTVLDVIADGLDGDRALTLLTGPIGRVDPVSLRQLRRTLRRADSDHPAREFGALLVDALDPDLPVGGDVPDQLARALKRVRKVLAAARRSDADGSDPRFTLWQAWHHTGLQRRWLTLAERTGTVGVQAGRDLDGVTALFDVAEQYVTHTTGASLTGVVDHVRAMVLPPADGGTARPGEAVTLLSAHAALGREWDFVVIAGLQEGLWPNVVPRGGVLATQQLVDVLDGIADGTSTRAPLLAEERRLLIAALGRARTRVLVTAVDGDQGDDAMLPSPFCDELMALATERPDENAEPLRAPRVLAPSAVVGRLRAVACAPEGAVEDAVRACAAAQLARLAEAGVPGSAPAQWYATTTASTEQPLWSDDGHVVTLSPSTVQTLADCPLRWLLERHGGSDGRDVRSALGTLVHALVSDPLKTEGQMLAELESVWAGLPFDAQWHAANELDRHRMMLTAFLEWRATTRHELTEVGTEVDVDGVVAAADAGQPGVRVRGRVDRLERDAEGRLVVVDVKTGKSPVSKDDAQRHAQLAMYQLAIAEGVLPQGDEAGGGRLVYLGKIGAAGATERDQNPMTFDGRDEWRDRVRQAAGATQGPKFVARVNDGCAHCPVRAMCPAQAASGGRS